jgi:hypothetical protein
MALFMKLAFSRGLKTRIMLQFCVNSMTILS